MEFGGFMKWNTQTHKVLRCKLKEFKFKENNNAVLLNLFFDDLVLNFIDNTEKEAELKEIQIIKEAENSNDPSRRHNFLWSKI